MEEDRFEDIRHRAEMSEEGNRERPFTRRPGGLEILQGGRRGAKHSHTNWEVSGFIKNTLMCISTSERRNTEG